MVNMTELNNVTVKSLQENGLSKHYIRCKDDNILVNMNIWQARKFYRKKNLLEKAATIKRFEYLRNYSELKKTTDIVKEQSKFFKDQVNINNNNMSKQNKRWW